MNTATYCGYVAIMGRANVGKSTLLNALLQRKISITSRKPQTTRFNILGIKTTGAHQFIYVDTPGLQPQEKRQLNQYLTKEALRMVNDVDVIVFVVEGLLWKKEDELVLEKLRAASCPVVLVINKVDKIAAKAALLPHIQNLSAKFSFAAIVPLSAAKGWQLSELEKVITPHLPESVWLFPPEQTTDRDQRFFIAEIIREKLTRLLGKELPYSLMVEVERMVEKKNILVINAVIFVETANQKIIVIGAKGEKLKQIGTLARKDLEKELTRKVFLELWVKVKSDWIKKIIL